MCNCRQLLGDNVSEDKTFLEMTECIFWKKRKKNAMRLLPGK